MNCPTANLLWLLSVVFKRSRSARTTASMFELHFLHPGMLAAAAAGVLPAIIHLLIRHKPVDVDFPTVRFIKSSVKTSSFKLRLKNLLLLLVRCAMIVLFALVLARPVIKSEHFSATDRAVVSAVIVLDDSYSMLYQDEGRTRFDAAKRMAGELMGRFEVGSEAVLLTTSNPVGSLTYDLDAVRNQIEAATAGPRKASIWSALARARALLADRVEMGREIYLFTDLTAQAFAGAAQIGSQFKEDVALCIVDCGRSESDNFALTDVDVSRRYVPLGSPIEVTVNGIATGLGGERVVRLIIDDKKVAQKGMHFGPQGAAECEFELEVKEPGSHRCTVEIAGEDPLPLDNARYFTTAAAPARQVLCVNGEPGEGQDDELFYLVRALRPQDLLRGPSADVSVCSPAELSSTHPRDWDVAVLCNVASLPPGTWQWLAECVARGRGLIVFAGDNVSPAAYNSGTAGSLMPAKVVTHAAPDKAVHFSFGAAARALTFAFRDGRNGDLTSPAIRRYVALERTPRHALSAVAIALGGKTPGVVTRHFQSGMVALVAVPADAEWSNFPKCACYAPFVHELVGFAAGQRMRTEDVTAGAVARLPLRSELTAATVNVHTPGSKRPAPAAVEPKKLVAAFKDTWVPGHYRWEVLNGEDREVAAFAVNADSEESRLTRVSRDFVTRTFPHARPLVAQDASELQSAVRETRVGREMYSVVLLVLIALMVAEGYLANRFYGVVRHA